MIVDPYIRVKTTQLKADQTAKWMRARTTGALERPSDATIHVSTNETILYVNSIMYTFINVKCILYMPHDLYTFTYMYIY